MPIVDSNFCEFEPLIMETGGPFHGRFSSFLENVARFRGKNMFGEN